MNDIESYDEGHRIKFFSFCLQCDGRGSMKDFVFLDGKILKKVVVVYIQFKCMFGRIDRKILKK